MFNFFRHLKSIKKISLKTSKAVQIFRFALRNLSDRPNFYRQGQIKKGRFTLYVHYTRTLDLIDVLTELFLL